MSDRIALDHGAGGRRSRDLVRDIFHKAFSNPALESETDAAIVSLDPGGEHTAGQPREDEGRSDGLIAVTTDAYVVKPLEFPGGDIGRLAVCGTVNDLAVSGATPAHLTAAFVIEEGFPVARLERIAGSMAEAADEAGVTIVAGDTKVVEHGSCDGLFISTAGVGRVPAARADLASAARLRTGDAVLVNGPVGDHGAAIACARNGINTEPPLLSDCAPLSGLIGSLYDAGIMPRFMRDATRGGLATVLCELASMAGADITVRDADIPVRGTVRGVCEMYGFDPLYLANEGTFLCVVAPNDTDSAVEVMRRHGYGRGARRIGDVTGILTGNRSGRAVLATAVGGTRLLRMLSGEQLPRIC